MRFNPNNGTPLFACYLQSSTTGFLPQIYRKVTSTETPSGNVNGDTDGKVDIADVTALVNMILGKAEKNEMAKINDDDDVTIADVTALVNIILGKN
jgi:hypothetical protein